MHVVYTHEPPANSISGQFGANAQKHSQIPRKWRNPFPTKKGEQLTCSLDGDVPGGDPPPLAPGVASAAEAPEELLHVVPAHLHREGLHRQAKAVHLVPLPVVGAGGHGLPVADEVGLVGAGRCAGQPGRAAADDVAVLRLGDEAGEAVLGV